MIRAVAVHAVCKLTNMTAFIGCLSLGKTMKKVRGFGTVDVDRPVIEWVYENGRQKVTWKDPAYTKWKNMIERCYGAPMKGRSNRYEGVTIASEWRSLKSFSEWYYARAPSSEKYVLDKDLLGEGKVYGPLTCCLIPNELNTFLSKTEDRGILPGVSKRRDGFEGVIQRGGKAIRVTQKVQTEIEAHLAWLFAKRDHLNVLIQRYMKDSSFVDTRVIGSLFRMSDDMGECLAEGVPFLGLSQKDR